MSTVTASATRIIDAPRDKVWHAETDPRHFEQWFGAKPGSARTDPRSGGTWSAVVTPGGEEIELSGQYVEVLEHQRLVITIPNGPEYVEVTITLTDLGDGRTEVTSSTPVPPEARQQAEEIASSILAKVAAIAEAL